MRRRPSWDELWMSVAQIIAERSACIRQYGAVIVSPANQILATGYNGPPASMSSERLGRSATCVDDCPRGSGRVTTLRVAGQTDQYGALCIAVHAEANALLFVDRTRCEGATLYVNGISCLDCAKLVSNSGIRRVVALDDSQPHRPSGPTRAFYSRCAMRFDLMPAPAGAPYTPEESL